MDLVTEMPSGGFPTWPLQGICQVLIMDSRTQDQASENLHARLRAESLALRH